MLSLLLGLFTAVLTALHLSRPRAGALVSTRSHRQPPKRTSPPQTQPPKLPATTALKLQHSHTKPLVRDLHPYPRPPPLRRKSLQHSSRRRSGATQSSSLLLSSPSPPSSYAASTSTSSTSSAHHYPHRVHLTTDMLDVVAAIAPYASPAAIQYDLEKTHNVERTVRHLVSPRSSHRRRRRHALAAAAPPDDWIQRPITRTNTYGKRAPPYKRSSKMNI